MPAQSSSWRFKPFIRYLAIDRTGLLGASGANLTGLPTYVICSYLAARLLVPVFLIVFAARGASTPQKVRLVRDYLLDSSCD